MTMAELSWKTQHKAKPIKDEHMLHYSTVVLNINNLLFTDKQIEIKI